MRRATANAAFRSYDSLIEFIFSVAASKSAFFLVRSRFFLLVRADFFDTR
jgi:hypothetical protein